MFHGIGLDLTQAGILGGANGLKGPFVVDFTKMADGVPGPANGGQPTLTDYAGVGPAFVQGGALVIDTVSAGYTGWRLPEDVEWIYTDMSFGKATDGAALIVTSDVSLASIVTTCLHIVIGPSSWFAQWGSSAVGSLTTVDFGSFPSVPLGKMCRIGWRISASGISLLLPNGTVVGPIASTALTSRTNNCAVIEHYNNNNEVPGIEFYKVAISCFANPAAAGRVNLLAAPNNLANAAWTKPMTGPTSGQLDADGGTMAEQMMETSANSFQFFYQGVAKAASVTRYTQRAKVKLIGRDLASFVTKNASFADLAPQDFDLTNGTLGAGQVGFASERFSTIYEQLGNGYAQIETDFLSDDTNAVYVAFGVANANGANVTGYAGDPTKGLLIYDQWLFERPV